MTPEPRLVVFSSPMKRRSSCSGELRGSFTSFEVEMFTTEGIAFFTAAWCESARSEAGTGPAGASCCSTATCGMREGSHSGFSVETTNSAATHTVVACEKMIQRRRMTGTANLAQFALCFNHLGAKTWTFPARPDKIPFPFKARHPIPTMSNDKLDKTPRNLLVATGAVSAAAGAAVAVPFAWSWFPSERAKAAGAPVEADISARAPGELKVVEWRGKPVWIMKRTKEQLEAIKAADGKVTDPKSDVPL